MVHYMYGTPKTYQLFKVLLVLPPLEKILRAPMALNYLCCFNMVSLYINTLWPTMIKFCNPIEKRRLTFAPLRSPEQSPWRHCCYHISSLAVQISVSENNSLPSGWRQINKRDAKQFQSHTPLLTSAQYVNYDSQVALQQQHSWSQPSKQPIAKHV